jgi:hypothetical protein
MDSPLSGPLLVAALVLLTALLAALVVGLALAARTSRRQAAATGELSAALAASEARAAELAERLQRLERRSAGPHPTEPLTGRLSRAAYDGEEDPAPATSLEGRVEVDGRLFTDIVVRETTIKAAGLWHGLRVALTPENRNRIRFEMKQEVKRSRRRRRDDLRAALRDLRARERAAMAREERDGEDAA